jgi:hypothetical protein
MPVKRYVTALVILLVSAISFLPYPVQAESEDISNAAVQFLLANNSARSSGMGGTIVSLVDEQSPLYNPGALGLLHMNKLATISLPNSTKWLPGLADDIRMKTFSISAGVSKNLLRPGSIGKFNAGIAVAHSKMKLDLGRVVRTSPGSPEIIADFDIYDKADWYSAAVGVDYYLRLGLGFTHKKIRSVLGDIGSGSEVGAVEASGTAYDIGVIVELPLGSLLREPGDVAQPDESRLLVDVTPSFAYVRANKGDDIAYLDAAQPDPLPLFNRTGISLFLELKSRAMQLGSARISWESEKLLVGETDRMIKYGVEAGLGGTLFLRAGSFDLNGSGNNISTFGLGFRLHGIISLLRAGRHPQNDNTLTEYLFEHLDISFDYAKHETVTGSDRKLLQFGLSF